MKRYEAFFPGAQLNMAGSNEKEAFYLGVLSYDTIYTRTSHLDLLKKTELFKDKNDLLIDDEDGNMMLDGNTFMLVNYYLNGDINVCRRFIKDRVLRDIYSLLSFNDNFIDDVFWHYFNDEKYSIFPSAELFLFIFNKLSKIYSEEAVRKDIYRLQVLLQDLIISEYYKQTYGINTIYTASHIMLMEMMSEMPVFLLEDENFQIIEGLQEYLPCYFSSSGIKKYYANTKELFKFQSEKKDNTIKLLFKEVLPNIADLPIEVIYNAKKKDKFKTLPMLAESLSSSKNLSNEDIIKYFDAELWKFANNSLRITASEVIFNVLGWIPLEPLSIGIQIFSQSCDAFNTISKYKQNGWIIPISMLKEESKKYIETVE